MNERKSSRRESASDHVKELQPSRLHQYKRYKKEDTRKEATNMKDTRKEDKRKRSNQVDSTKITEYLGQKSIN